MSGLAEGFGFSAIGLTSGHGKWVLAHNIKGCIVPWTPQRSRPSSWWSDSKGGYLLLCCPL